MRSKSIALLAALTVAAALPTSAAPATFQSNAIKYRDSSKKPATGRSGSASIQARALVNKDHTADLELTTGTFDPPASRGNIDKVRIKSQSTGTINDNRLTNNGTYAVKLPSVDRGQKLSINANVSGIDGRRVDVVAVTETAKLRPDLAVGFIQIPPAVIAGSPVLIDAAVRELNGDHGARARCVLRVNGVSVDEANGIWVDAGRSVSCSFLYRFGAVGSTLVQVAVTNVDPGDYDTANNAMETSVTVRAAELGMQRWSAGSAESEWRSDTISEASWGYHNEVHQSGWTNSTGFSAFWGENLDLATLKVSYAEKQDGKVIVNLRNMPLRRDDRAFEGHGPGQCMVGVDDLVSVVICQRPYMPPQWLDGPERPRYINPMFSRRSGDVTYLSRQWGKPSPDAPDGSYVKNENIRTKEGLQIRLGNTVSLEVEISDATRAYAERPTYVIDKSRVTDASSPWRCWNSYWCGEWSFYEKQRWGSTKSPGQ